MGQRTRMGRAKTKGRPISRAELRTLAQWKLRQAAIKRRDRVDAGTEPTDNAAGRARHAAKHAGQPRVTYPRAEQSSYGGPKTAPPAATTPPLPAYRKTGVEMQPGGRTRFVWHLITFLTGR